jgi:hypothetical protein
MFSKQDLHHDENCHITVQLLDAVNIFSFCNVKKCREYYCILQIDSGEDAQEEFGWKLVHGDVFRPPRKGMLLSVLLGSGTQVFCMSLITLGKITLSVWK